MGQTRSYYNENDAYCVQWLRNLIDAGLIAPGDVDDRDIRDVRAADLVGYDQCHFFAGIGGWSYALRLAGWPDDHPVWTGSCPCQPFSSAGKRRGAADDRHLWPEFRRLIADCAPPVVFGEQVASKDGRLWLAGVRADLEALGYGVGAADLCAAGVGAPHIRQRLWWVADADGQRQTGIDPLLRPEAGERESADLLEAAWRGNGGGGLAESNSPEGERQRYERISLEPEQEAARPFDAIPWAASTLIGCADGKARRIEPGLEPLAHGIPARVGKLRAYGNAIVPQVAAEFIISATEAMRG